MNSEVKQQWITALRSGGYVQTTGVLYETRDGEPLHCALGVLAEEALKAGILPEGNPNSLYESRRYGPNVSVDRLLPQEVADWIGFGAYVEGEMQVYKLNDHEGLPFSEIADWIEENL